MNNRRRKALEYVINIIKDLIGRKEVPDVETLEKLSETLNGFSEEEDEAVMNMPDNLFATEKYQDMLDNMCDLLDATAKVNEIIEAHERIKWTGCKTRLEAAIHSIRLAVDR